MANERVCGVIRCVVGVMCLVAVVVLCGTLADSAHADGTTTGSRDEPRAGLLNADVGRIDDPAEEVPEHPLPFGDDDARS